MNSSCRQHPFNRCLDQKLQQPQPRHQLQREYALPQLHQQPYYYHIHQQQHNHSIHHNHHYHHHHDHHRQQLPVLVNIDRRLAYVEALLDIMTNMVEIMWRGIYQDVGEPEVFSIVSIRSFIREVMKRSHTTYATAQIAICYLFQTQQSIRRSLLKKATTVDQQKKTSFISCPRRMFLASLIVASKYVQDKTYRNSAWASIARIHVHQVNMAERIFLELCDYQLYMKQNVFDDLHRLLRDYVADALAEPPVSSLYHISFAWTPEISTPAANMCHCSSRITSSLSSATTTPSTIRGSSSNTISGILPVQQELLMVLPYSTNNTNNNQRNNSGTMTVATAAATAMATNAIAITAHTPPQSLHQNLRSYTPQMTYARSGVKRPRAADNNTPDFNQQQQYRQPNKRCKSQTPPCLLRPTRTQFVLGHAPCI